MKLCHILFCFIFLYLQDGNTGLANAETPVYEGVEGGNITVECKFYLLGSKMLFCKDKCEKANVLIETTDHTAQSGRYSIKYEKNYFSKDIVHASITQLNKSDSGWYSCTLDTSLQPCDFQLVITGASNISTPHQPLSTSTFLLSASTTTTTTTVSRQPQTAAGSGLSLELVIRLSVVVVLLPVVLLLIYRITAEGSNGLNSRRHSAFDHTEIGLSEIDRPVSSCEDSTYQSLNTASRDHGQTYSTLRHNNQFSDMNSCEAE
ncbi:uncharacterized protein LOC120727968 [Simochromis diagramma]|uniref:uncharacterized protein LOC120727968 n=1 Tax=Simochromis diagramma TaxID=43689 RepID=UPI001A7EF672|nr:uncharacterized protein LOC120727968 [Simochromis diagramma]